MQRLELKWHHDEYRWLRHSFSTGRYWDPEKGIVDLLGVKQWELHGILEVDGVLLLTVKNTVVGVCTKPRAQDPVDWLTAPPWANVLLTSSDDRTRRVWAASFTHRARAQPATAGQHGPSCIDLSPRHRWELVATRPAVAPTGPFQPAPSSAVQKAPEGPFWVGSGPTPKSYPTEQEAILAASRAAKADVGREFVVYSVHKTVKCEVQIK